MLIAIKITHFLHAAFNSFIYKATNYFDKHFNVLIVVMSGVRQTRIANVVTILNYCPRLSLHTE